MPIYEYVCKSCSTKFELNRQFGQNSGASCPQCKSEAQRIYSPVPVFFKGSGFYVTDNIKREKIRDGRNGNRPVNVENAAKPSQMVDDKDMK